MWRVDSVLRDGVVSKEYGWLIANLEKALGYAIVLINDEFNQQFVIEVNKSNVIDLLRRFRPYGFVDDGRPLVVSVDKMAYDFLSLVESVEYVFIGRNQFVDRSVVPIDGAHSLWKCYGDDYGYYNLLDMLAFPRFKAPSGFDSGCYFVYDEGALCWRIRFTDTEKAKLVINKRVLHSKLVK